MKNADRHDFLITHSNPPKDYVQTTNTNSMLQTYNSDVCCNGHAKTKVVSNHSHIMNSEKSYHRLQCLWRTFHGGNVSCVSAAWERVACNYRHSLQS